jgi:hypothetical protein
MRICRMRIPPDGPTPHSRPSYLASVAPQSRVTSLSFNSSTELRHIEESAYRTGSLQKLIVLESVKVIGPYVRRLSSLCVALCSA